MQNIVHLEGRTLIALGKGLTLDPKTNKVFLTIESKFTTIAAGLLFKRKHLEKIVFTGGRTLGKEYISEAEAMKKYLLKVFTDIPAEAVLVECDSIDTLGNITEMVRLGLIKPNTVVPVLSVGVHLRRSRILFWNIAKIKAQTFSSEQVIKEFGISWQQKKVSSYNHSIRFFRELAKEIVGNFVVLFDKKGEMLRNITKKTRHAEA